MEVSNSSSNNDIEAYADVDEGAIVKLFGDDGEGIGTQELSGTGLSYRHDWGNFNGSRIYRLNWGFVTPATRVFVSVAEGAAGGPAGGKFIGSARYTLHNVAPRAGGVDIWVNIEWGGPIRLYVDYLAIR